MNEFEHFSSDELPPELAEIEELLLNSPQPDVPDSLLDNLLSQVRTRPSRQPGVVQSTVRIAAEKQKAKRSLSDLQHSDRRAQPRRISLYAATLVIALGGVVCLWPLFQTKSPDQADIADLPHDNTVVVQFSQETDPCFILPQ